VPWPAGGEFAAENGPMLNATPHSSRGIDALRFGECMLNTASEQTGAVASTGAPTELKAARRADSGNSGSVPRQEPEPRESRMNRIAQRAHQIYEARGGEHGKAMEDWLQAEREIDAELDNARAERAE
jgi:hypothetical protein